jgi:hypothetical protein
MGFRWNCHWLHSIAVEIQKWQWQTIIGIEEMGHLYMIHIQIKN